jgi:predicted GNAT family acetyltransferase
MSTNTQVRNNRELKRFELEHAGHTAFIDYIHNPNQKVYHLTHTEVPTAIEGQGVGHRLIEGSFNLLKQKG